jgi:hypothetical protein
MNRANGTMTWSHTNRAHPESRDRTFSTIFTNMDNPPHARHTKTLHLIARAVVTRRVGITLDPGSPLIRSHSITLMRMIDATVVLQSTQSDLSLPKWEAYISGRVLSSYTTCREALCHSAWVCTLSFFLHFFTHTNPNVSIA